MRFNRPLTKPEMKRIRSKVNGDFPELGIKEFYLIALEDIGETWAEQTSIKPYEFAIPSNQHAYICDMLGDLRWQWMNQGPTYSESV